MIIQPKYMKLWELLTGRLFRIPHYQRAYSWERKQREDLFEDIKNLGSAENAHFMATMVGLARSKQRIVTDEFQEIEIVDGQQRLTTLIVLLKALALALDRNEKRERTLGQEIDALLIKDIKDDRLSLLLLQTNHDSSNYFQDYLRTGKQPDPSAAQTVADRLLLQAFADCKEFVASWDDRLLLGAILKNRLTVIFHEIEDELAVYTVFEVLNSRGLEVAWLDRLKSVLMGIAFETSKGNKKETIDELHRIWGDVYRCVGLHQGRSTEALRFAATLKSKETLSKTLGQEAAVDTLREMAERSAKAPSRSRSGFSTW